VIWVGRKQEYFFGGDWTTQITLIRFRKLDFGSGGFCEAGIANSALGELKPQPLGRICLILRFVSESGRTQGGGA
jgi:hypothetical protein